MHVFRAAVEERRIDDIAAMLDEHVVFHSPVAFNAYKGRDVVDGILRAAFETFEDFTYLRELNSPLDGYTGLVFKAKVDGLAIEGCDFIHETPGNLIDEFTVMLRPMKATQLFSEKMGAKLSAR